MEIINAEKINVSHYVGVLDNKTYWMESVIHAFEVYNIIERIPNSVLEFIKNGPIHLLITNQWECFATVPEVIYKELVLKQGIPEHKIIFLSGARDIQQIVYDIVSKINQETNTNFTGFTAKFFGWFQYNISKNYKQSNKMFEFKRNLAIHGRLDYKKHFLLLNRRWRIHRPTLVGLLHSKDLLDYGYTSLGLNDQDLHWDNAFEECLKANKDCKQIIDLLLSNKEKITSLPELVLDNVDFDKKTPNLVKSLDYYYETSFCSIVTETYFYDWSTVFMSEKTFRPIAYKQPFIMVSVPYTLDFLHELGYKTFHPLIDESYDTEKNDGQRMLMIVKEIEKICKLTQKELKELSLEFKDICNHNQKKLLSYSS